MDRQGWIAVILCIVGLFAWQFLMVKQTSRPGQGPPAAVPATTGQVKEAARSAPTPPPAPTLKPQATIAEKTEKLQSREAEYVFSNDAGGIERVILLLHYAEKKSAVFLGGDRSFPMGALGFQPGEVVGGFEMDAHPENGSVVFRKVEEDGLEIIKRFTVPAADAANPYLVTLSVEFHNTSQASITRDAFFLSVGGAAPIHATDLPTYTKFDWMHGKKLTAIDVNWFNPRSIPLVGIQLSGPKSLYHEEKPDVAWAGSTSQYFCTIVTGGEAKGSQVWASRFNTRKPDNSPVTGIQGAIGFPGFRLSPGEKTSGEFTIYAGPKNTTLLRDLGGGQERVLNFGMFGVVSEVLLWGMNRLYGVFHNYAAAIIVLTLIIKSLLWPVQNKATKEMRKMAALSPKMTELRAKYKDEPQKLNEEMMKMYREYGINPLSGCLPMVIQVPIFFGFYAMLGSAIELRNSSFLWVQDLSQPDTLFHIMSFPVNILPLVMAGTMVWQMVISPKSGDAMQQRMFYFMPIIFLVFCYNYASALALYWTTQNLFSIVQLYLTRNQPLPTLEKKSVIAKREAAASRKKKKHRLP